MISSRHAVCRLVGALRLTDSEDGIGIPLYNHPGSNELFVGETDFDLRITKFVSYPDAESFRIDYGILEVAKERRFAIGEYSLVPFWLNDRPNALPGGLTVSEFDDIFGANPGGVGDELRGIISRSRSGYYQRLRSEGERDFILNEYPDVWDEEPVNSLYWVSRFRSAAIATSRLQNEALAEMHQFLRERAQQWIDRFQFKGHFRLLLEIVRTANDGLFDHRDLQLVLFDSLIDRIERGDIGILKRPEVKNAVMHYFPKGLFYFHVWENDAIQGRYHSRRNRELRRPILQPRIRIDFYGMLERYLYDDVWHHLPTLLALTSAIYGSSELPAQILQRLHGLYLEKVASVRYELNKAYNEEFRDIRAADMWPEKAKRLLSEINSVNQMLRILEAPSRLTGVLPPNLKVFSADQVDDLRRYLEE